MRSLARTSRRAKPVMNVTPLVDVVLVLLIIFMVVLPEMEDAIHVELPTFFHVDADAKSKLDPFNLSLTEDGSLYFGRQRLELDELAAELRQANQQEPWRRLVLRADRGAPYRAVRGLFRECQEVGFPGLSLKVNDASPELK